MTPEQRRALGARLKAERCKRKWCKLETARRLRDALADSQSPDLDTLLSYVKRWEAGKVRVSERYQFAYATAFDMPLDALFPADHAVQEGTAVGVGINTPSPTPDPGDHDVKRRTLLEVMAALSAGIAIPVDALSTILSGVDDALTERSDMDPSYWEEVTWEYSRKIWIQPTGVLLRDLTVDVLAVGSALRRRPRADVRKGLLRSSAEITVYMAQEFGDLGDTRAARRCFATATRAADESGDLDLATWVRGYDASRALWEGRSVSAVNRVIGDTFAAARGTPGVGLAQALEAQARFRAVEGDAVAAEQCLTELRRVFTALPDKATEDEISAWGYSEHVLRSGEAWTYSLLGDTRRARVAIEQALETAPLEKTGGRTNIKLLRALTLVHEREVTEGLEYAVTTTQSVPSSLARRRAVDEIIKALPGEKARALPAVRELQALTTPASRT